MAVSSAATETMAAAETATKAVAAAETATATGGTAEIMNAAEPAHRTSNLVELRSIAVSLFPRIIYLVRCARSCAGCPRNLEV